MSASSSACSSGVFGAWSSDGVHHEFGTAIGYRVRHRDRLHHPPALPCQHCWLVTRARLDPGQLELEIGHLDVPPPPSSEQPATR